MVKTFRTLKLQNATIPVIVEHSKLDKTQRVDSLSSRIDTLDTSLSIFYEHNASKPKSFDHIVDFSKLYETLAFGKIRTQTGPLEELLDEIYLCAKNQVIGSNCKLQHLHLQANRMGLIVGYPRLELSEGPLPTLYGQQSRIAGIREYPLILNLDHSWISSTGTDAKAVRTEQISVSFRVHTKMTPLSGDLKGLFNYANMVKTLDSFQGITYENPMECLADELAAKLRKDCEQAGLQILGFEIELAYSAYPRVTPVVGLFSIVQ